MARHSILKKLKSWKHRKINFSIRRVHFNSCNVARLQSKKCIQTIEIEVQMNVKF